MLVTTQSHAHGHHQHPHADTDEDQAEMKRIMNVMEFLLAHFGSDEVELHIPESPEGDEPEQGEGDRDPIILIRLDEADAMINLPTLVCVSVNGPQSSPKLFDDTGRNEFK